MACAPRPDGRPSWGRAEQALAGWPPETVLARLLMGASVAAGLRLSRPKLRGTAEAFASRLFGSHVTTANALETLVIASFARGLSVRDVAAALAEALGDQAAISRLANPVDSPSARDG